MLHWSVVKSSDPPSLPAAGRDASKNLVRRVGSDSYRHYILQEYLLAS
jgi:hypothetical protein